MDINNSNTNNRNYIFINGKTYCLNNFIRSITLMIILILLLSYLTFELYQFKKLLIEQQNEIYLLKQTIKGILTENNILKSKLDHALMNIDYLITEIDYKIEQDVSFTDILRFIKKKVRNFFK